VEIGGLETALAENRPEVEGEQALVEEILALRQELGLHKAADGAQPAEPKAGMSAGATKLKQKSSSSSWCATARRSSITRSRRKRWAR